MSLYVITIERFLTTDMHIQAGQVRGQAGQGRGWIYISLCSHDWTFFDYENAHTGRANRVRQVRQNSN